MMVLPEIGGLAGLAWGWTLTFAPRVLAALLIVIVGLFVANRLAHAAERVLGGLALDAAIRPFIAAVVQYGVLFLVLLLAMGQLGIQTTSLLAVLGAAGLAIGLALQATLSNIAAGIMLVWLRPFEVGDFVEVGAISGTVETTGLFACRLRAFDGARLFVPNSNLWNVTLRNHSRTGARLIALSVTLDAAADPAAAEPVLREALSAFPQSLPSPEPAVFLEAFNASGSVLACRVWVEHGHYGAAQRGIVAHLRNELVAKRVPAIAIQQIGRLVPASADSLRLVEL